MKCSTAIQPHNTIQKIVSDTNTVEQANNKEDSCHTDNVIEEWVKHMWTGEGLKTFCAKGAQQTWRACEVSDRGPLAGEGPLRLVCAGKESFA